MDDAMKILKSLEEPSLLIKDVTYQYFMVYFFHEIVSCFFDIFHFKFLTDFFSAIFKIC